MNALPLKENLKKFTRTATCPVRNVISRFSGKWSLLVICVLAEIPPRVEYSLTDLGSSLLPHLYALISWGAENFDKMTRSGNKGTIRKSDAVRG